MACIRKRRGRWVIDYRDASGKRRWETVEGNRKDADDRLSKIIASGKRVVDTKRTFQEHAEDWLTTYAKTHVRESSFREYESVIKNHLYPVFGSLPFSKITREMVKRLIAEKIEAGLSRSRVRGIICPLRELYNHAIDDGVLTFNPAARLGRFNKSRGDEKPINPLTREELALMLEVVNQKLPHYYPLMLCAARTGLRQGELVGLQFADIDFNGRFIEVRRSISKGRVTTPKNHKTRRVDMSLQLTNVLDKHLAQRKAKALRDNMEKPHPQRKATNEVYSGVMEQLVFVTPKGTRLDPNSMSTHVFHRVLDLAGIRQVRFHDLRHSYASLLLQQGESLIYVRDQLGHHSIQITVDTYGHLVPGSNRQAADKLDDVEWRSGSKTVATPGKADYKDA